MDKWMRMMTVKRRDEGGNVQEWAWRDRGKVSRPWCVLTSVAPPSVQRDP